MDMRILYTRTRKIARYFLFNFLQILTFFWENNGLFSAKNEGFEFVLAKLLFPAWGSVLLSTALFTRRAPLPAQSR